ncbi:SBBP repeat-containing protein [Myxosarcina sp. GI1(2024)]
MKNFISNLLGNIVIPGSPGSDLLFSNGKSSVYWGRDGNDTFYIAPEANNPLQIDLLFGDLVDGKLFPGLEETPRDWQDRFILGDWHRPYYVSSLPFPLGLNQFAVIADLNPELDRIELHGTPEDYQLVSTPVGTALVWQQLPTPDLIALFPLAEDLSLESDYFQFEGDTPPEGSQLETVQQLGTEGVDGWASTTTDSLGNVYVAGGSNIDVRVAKYDRDGVRHWLRDFGSSGSESVTEIVSDPEGNLYVVGVTNGDLAADNAGSFDVWLAKYDSEGNQLWLEQFGDELVDLSYSINLDDDGNVYLTGHSGKIDNESPLGQTLEPWVTKYDSDGNQLWFQQLEGMKTSEAYGITFDDRERIYLTGWTLGDPGEDGGGLYDIWLTQLDSDGKLVWREQFGSEDYEFPWGMDSDSQGNTYVSGWTLGDLGGVNAGSYDPWIAKYDSEGNQLWVEQFGTSGDDGSFLGDIEVDSDDNIFLTGYTDSNLGGTNAGSYDPWVAKYDSKGNQLWIQQFGTPEFDHPTDITTDDADNLYVTGLTEGSLSNLNTGSVDGWIAKLDAESGALKDFGNDNFNSIGSQANPLEGQLNQLPTTDTLTSLTTGLDSTGMGF